MSRPPGRHVAMLVTLFELFNTLEHFIPRGIETIPDETEPIKSRNAIAAQLSLASPLALSLYPKVEPGIPRPLSRDFAMTVFNSELMQIGIHLCPRVVRSVPRKSQGVKLLEALRR